MIAKIGRSSANVSSPLFYNQRKVEQGTAQLLASFNINTTGNTNDFKNIYQELKFYEELNHNMKKKSFHVSLNLNPKESDDISDEKYIAIAHEYMKGMGYGEQPFVIYKHKDTERTHIHIVSVRIDENGKKINDSHEKRVSWEVIKGLTPKYNLMPIEPRVSSSIQEKVKAATAQHEQIRLGQLDYFNHSMNYKVDKLRNLIDFANLHDCSSFSEYRTLLNTFNVDIVEVKTPKGDHKGLKFYIKNPLEPNVLTFGIAASKIQKGFTKDFLEESFQSNRYKRKVQKNQFRNFPKTLNYVLSKFETINLTDLQEELNKQGYQIITYKNAKSEIYGVSIYDFIDKKIFKGSEVNLSANELKSIISESTHLKPNQKKLNTVVQAEYNKLKKSEKYYFESNFIQALPRFKTLLINEVSKRMNLDKTDPSLIITIDNFIAEKEINKDSIKLKEEDYIKDYINKNILFGMNYIKPSLQNEYLKANNILVSMGDKNYPIITYTLNEKEKPIMVTLNGTNSYLESLAGSTGLNKNIKLNYLDKKIIRNIESLGKLNFDYIDVDTSFIALSNPSTKENIITRMLTSIVEQQTTENVKVDQLLDNLLKRGVLLHKENNIISLQDYNGYCKIEIPQVVREKLKNIDIDHYIKTQNKLALWNCKAYDIYLQFNRYKITDNPYNLNKAVYAMGYVNAEYAKKIEHYLDTTKDISKDHLTDLFHKGLSKYMQQNEKKIESRNQYFRNKR